MLYVLVPALVVVILGGAILWYAGSQNSTAQSGTSPSSASFAQQSEQAQQLVDVIWPTYVSRGAQPVKEAYQFAVMRPDVLQYMPCYCGCGQHNGHRSNEECFIANMNQGGKTIAFDQHGST